jgi:hypothetical protein
MPRSDNYELVLGAIVAEARLAARRDSDTYRSAGGTGTTTPSRSSGRTSMRVAAGRYTARTTGTRRIRLAGELVGAPSPNRR